MSPFEYRGVVEGFYGPAYSESERLDLIEAIGAHGMNVYLYAPKDDALQRERWREPYPRADLDRFAHWIARGEAAGVRVGFALSPGLSMEYASSDDISALCEKFAHFRDLGCRFFSLQLDDVPSTLQHTGDRKRFDSLAHAHVATAERVAEVIGRNNTLWLVPTDYAGTRSSAYLETLGSELAPEIEVAWTGRTVVSPSITASEARERARVLRRRILLWDNYPVTDGPMRPMLHLGPYQGRPAELLDSVSGVLLNPMELPRASRVALFTGADYMRAPEHYDADASFTQAVRAIGTGAEAAFATFAAAHGFSPLAPNDRDRELEACFHAFREASDAQRETRLGELDRAVSVREAACDTLRSQLADRKLLSELEPWLQSFADECHRMRIAVDFHLAFEAAEHAMDRFTAYSRFEGRLTHLAGHPKVSFGPRQVLYPQLVGHEDDTAAFGQDPALFLGECLADAFLDNARQVAAEALDVRTSRAAPR